MRTQLGTKSAELGELEGGTSAGSVSRRHNEQTKESIESRIGQGPTTVPGSGNKEAPGTPGGLVHTLYLLFTSPKKLAHSAAIAGSIFGAASAFGPGVAHADYIDLGQDGQPKVVQSEKKARVIASATTGEAAFEPGKLQSYDMFKLFWNSDVEGTSQEGVWSLSPKGVAALLKLAQTQTLDGKPIAINGTPKAVSAGHRALVEYLLKDSYYSAFIAQEAVPLLRLAFDLPEVKVEHNEELAPKDAGEVRVCSDSEWWGSKGIDGWNVRGLPDALVTEYGLGAAVGRYEGAASTKETKAYELTCLLSQFSKALNRLDDLALPANDQVRPKLQQEMLDKFLSLPAFDETKNPGTAKYLREFFAKDYNGSGMGLAQALVKDFDPNKFPTSFPNASDRSSPVTMSMSTSDLKKAMEALDEWRTASGMEPLAMATKLRPALGYVVGDPSGHAKAELHEEKPLSSGVNFGKLIEFGTLGGGFKKSEQVAALPPTKGFEIPIDVVRANGWAVLANRPGDTIEIVDRKTGARVNAEVVIEKTASGKPQSWSAKFTDASGNELEPKQVLGLIKRGGTVLGDGKANQALETGYWGMCDDNTGAHIIFGRYPDLPKAFVGQLGDDKVYVRAGDKLVPINVVQARELVYMDLPGIGGTEWPNNAGYRYGYDSSKIRWARDGWVYTNTGRLNGFDLSPLRQKNHDWLTGDRIRVRSTKDEPIFGTIRLDGTYGPVVFNAADLRSVIKLPDGQLKFYRATASGGMTSAEGKPVTEINLDWSKAVPRYEEGSNTPGSIDYVGDDANLQSIFDKKVGPAGISFEFFKELNSEYYNRPAASMVPGEYLTLPPLHRTYVTKPGDTIASVLQTQGKPVEASRWYVERDNKELFAQAEPKLKVGTVLRMPIPQREYKPKAGDTLATIYDRLVKRTGVSLSAFKALNAAPFNKEASGQALDPATDVIVLPEGEVRHRVAANEKSLRKIVADHAEKYGPGASDLADQMWNKLDKHHKELIADENLLLPAGVTMQINGRSDYKQYEGEGLITLADYYEQFVKPRGSSLEEFKEANKSMFERKAGWLKSGDQVKIPELTLTIDKTNAIRGEFDLLRDDGVKKLVKAEEVELIEGETPFDIPFTHYVRFVQMSLGVYGQDSSQTRSISNGRKWVSDVVFHQTHGADRPEWAKDKPLTGRFGPLERQVGDKIVFVAGMAKTNMVFSGWYQVDEKSGRVLNEGFTTGEPDFAWGTIDKPLNWHSQSTYIGSAMTTELRLMLFINGHPELRKGGEKADAIAKTLNLPGNWKSYLVSADEVKAAGFKPTPKPKKDQS